MSSLYHFCPWRGRSPLMILAMLLLAAQAALAAGTPIYSANGATVARQCTKILGATLCFGKVSTPNKAADGNFNSAATIDVPLSLLASSNIKLRMNLAQAAPKNYRAGVVVRRNGSLLSLAGLNLSGRLILRTFLNSQEQQAVPVSASVVQAVLGGEADAVRLEFVASQPFDQIELQAGALLSLGYKLDVLYAYAIDANVVEKADGYASRFTNPSAANYSTAVTDDNGVTICVNNSVANPQNAVDEDLTNYATLGSLVSVSCPSTLQTQLEGTAPAGYEAGFVLGSAGLLDVSVLDGLRISTYLAGQPQERANGAGLLKLQLLPNGQSVVYFPTTKPFDRVELRRTSLLSALDNVQVYYGFGVTSSTFRDEEPRLSAFTNPAANYRVSGSTALISNPERAADNNLTTNYATVGSLLGALTAPRLKLRLDGPGKAGNTAGVVLGLGTGLIDADVLRNIRIRTYNGATGNQLVETAIGADLLSLELLANGRSRVSFLTTRDFDWVEVELATGVSVLSNTNIYYAFAEDRPTGFPATIVVPSGPLPVQLTTFAARAKGLAVEVSWQTATELDSHYFEVQRSGEAGRGFVTVGKQQAAGTSTENQYYTLTDAAAAQLPAGLLYYRLRQVDLDGSETYSAVVIVRRQVSVGPLVLYPNPASAGGQLRISGLPTLPEGNYQLLLYSMQGALVSRQSLYGTAADIVVPSLEDGVYQAVICDAAGRPVGRQRLVLAQGR